MLWMLEPDVFAPGTHPMRAAVLRAGQRAIDWDDQWWHDASYPAASEEATVFHGSLGNAARIAALGRWQPGALCAVEAFACSSWYPRFAEQLVHREFRATTVRELCAAPTQVAGALADGSGRVFVRPDSPLKPFSGRVVALEGLTPGHLDHGFYFEDLDLPVIVAPLRSLGREWRFVVAGGALVASSAYLAQGRQADAGEVPEHAQRLAEQLASHPDLPMQVCIVDLGEADGELCLLEFNPFSGADLYACELDAVVRGVSAVLEPEQAAR